MNTWMEAESIINFIKLLSLGTRLFNLCNITRYIHKALLHSEVEWLFQEKQFL